MILEQIDDLINDTYYKLDNFKSNKSNIIFITGIYGSGKSTLGEELAKKYNATFIPLDDITFNNYHIINKIDWNQLNDNDKLYYDFIFNYLKYIINYTKQHPKQKFIIEGIQLSFPNVFDLIKNQSIIIKNTSFIDSSIRSFKRDYNYIKTNNGMLGIANEFIRHYLIKNYQINYKNIKLLKRKLQNDS